MDIERGWLVLSCAFLAFAGSGNAQVPTPVPFKAASDEAPGLLPECSMCWFGIKEEEDAKIWWAQVQAKALTAATILLHPDYFTTDVDVASDVLWIFRLSAGLTISSSQADTSASAAARDSLNTSTETANRLLQQGGTIHLSAMYPIMYAGNGTKAFAALVLQLGGGFDFPRVGAITKDPGLSGTAGLDLSGRAFGASKNIGLEGGAHLQGYAFNKDLAARLGTDAKSSGMFSVRASLLLLKQTRLGFVIPVAKSRAFEAIRTSGFIQQNVSF